MVASLILFVLFILFYVAIVDIITILFRLTGMTEERARFQVISLLTNSGFTTQESESIVTSKVRRRLARSTMLFGYAFTVTIMSAVVNLFVNMSRSELSAVFVSLPVLLLTLVGIYFLRRAPVVKKTFDGWIERIGHQIMFGKNTNQVILMEDYGNVVVAHIYLVVVPEMLLETTLADSQLMTNHNLMIMTVKPPNGEVQQANAATILHPKDTIMVMGKRRVIRDVFERAEQKITAQV